MSRGLVRALTLSLALGLAGCGRHVVVEPQTALRANDRAWKVTSEPRQAVVLEGDAGR